REWVRIIRSEVLYGSVRCRNNDRRKLTTKSILLPIYLLDTSRFLSARRYVVRAKHLNHSIFRLLLKEAEEEYGFSNISPLAIPCDESLFEEIIGVLTRSKPCGRDNMATLEYIRRCIHVWMAEKMKCIYMPISAVAFCHC
ncbi:LOW QUALITY PROTEIN: hypothetical protein HID58_057042, partial [Brassica napus]